MDETGPQPASCVDLCARSKLDRLGRPTAGKLPARLFSKSVAKRKSGPTLTSHSTVKNRVLSRAVFCVGTAWFRQVWSSWPERCWAVALVGERNPNAAHDSSRPMSSPPRARVPRTFPRKKERFWAGREPSRTPIGFIKHPRGKRPLPERFSPSKF